MRVGGPEIASLQVQSIRSGLAEGWVGFLYDCLDKMVPSLTSKTRSITNFFSISFKFVLLPRSVPAITCIHDIGFLEPAIDGFADVLGMSRPDMAGVIRKFVRVKGIILHVLPGS